MGQHVELQLHTHLAWVHSPITKFILLARHQVPAELEHESFLVFNQRPSCIPIRCNANIPSIRQSIVTGRDRHRRTTETAYNIPVGLSAMPSASVPPKGVRGICVASTGIGIDGKQKIAIRCCGIQEGEWRKIQRQPFKITRTDNVTNRQGVHATAHPPFHLDVDVRFPSPDAVAEREVTKNCPTDVACRRLVLEGCCVYCGDRSTYCPCWEDDLWTGESTWAGAGKLIFIVQQKVTDLDGLVLLAGIKISGPLLKNVIHPCQPYTAGTQRCSNCTRPPRIGTIGSCCMVTKVTQHFSFVK